MGAIFSIKSLTFNILTQDLPAIFTDKIIKFFVSTDDFCIEFELEIQKHLLD